MKSVKELRQERAEKIAGMTRLNVAAEGEERDLTDDEKKEYDGLKTAAALLADGSPGWKRRRNWKRT